MTDAPWADLSARELPLHTRRAGERWTRIHRQGTEAAWFGPAPGDPPTHRFDDPEGEYRACYVGRSIAAAFAETLLRSPPHRIVSLRELAGRSVTAVRLKRDIRLVTFHSEGLARLGLTAREAHGPYDACGRWARAIWGHPARPDGIEYRSRHDDAELCVALFERARDAMEERSTEDLTKDAARLRSLLRRYGVALTR